MSGAGVAAVLALAEETARTHASHVLCFPEVVQPMTVNTQQQPHSNAHMPPIPEQLHKPATFTL
jgi:hypothetical protein